MSNRPKTVATAAMLIAGAFFATPVVHSFAAANGENPRFPLREKYEECKPISTSDLWTLYGEAIIVDVRNTVEYDVIRIQGAHNVVLGTMKELDLKKLRADRPDAPLVFYCNGVTCSKSYQAARTAIAWGFDNVFVYDDGVFAFAETFPHASEFFGETMTPEVLQTQIIPDEKFKAACIDPGEFVDRALSGDFVVFDIRDNADRTAHPIDLPGIKKVNMDQFVKFLEKDGAIPAENILLIDNVGKQVKWVQYYLERSDRSNYFFLKGGVAAWRNANLDSTGQVVANAGG